MSYPHISRKLFAEPWAIEPGAHRAMVAAFRNRLASPRALMDDDEEDAPRAKAERKDGDHWMTSYPAPGLAVLTLRGIIGNHLSMLEMLCGGCDLHAAHSALDQISERRIETLLVNIDSPGGTVTGLFEFCERLRSIGDSGVHTVAFTETIMASAAYAAAASCDEIHVSNSSRVGSVGVYTWFLDDSVAYEMDGLKMEYFVGNNAALKVRQPEGLPMSDAARKRTQQDVDFIADKFAAWVEANRQGIDVEKMRTGDCWLGEMLPAGFADTVGKFQTFETLLGAFLWSPSRAAA